MKRSKYFEHLIAIQQNPDAARAAQAKIDAQRLADVQRALQIRPACLPVTHNLPAAQNLPTPVLTDELSYPVIITGAVTDGENKSADIYIERENNQPFVRYGNDTNKKLSLDAFAGKAEETGAVQGIVNFEPEILLDESKSITLALYNNSGAPETVNTVFVGNRIYKTNSAEAQMSSDTLRNVQENIRARPVPAPRFAVVPIVFENGVATGSTPKAGEPLMIYGFRSTVSRALVNFGFDAENLFAKRSFPIWALASERNNARRLYNLLNSPLFISKGEQLTFLFKNTIDGVNFAGDGQLELLMRTV